MLGSSRQDLSAWIARVAHSGDPFAYFSPTDLAPGSFEEFHGDSGVVDFFGAKKPALTAVTEFHASSLHAYVGSVFLYSTLRTSSEFERSGEDFTGDAREKLVVVGVLRGTLRFRNGKHSGVLSPGEVLVANSTHPLITKSVGVVETLGMAVSIEDVAKDTRMTGGNWPARLPSSALTAAFLAFTGRYLVETVASHRATPRSTAVAEPMFYDLLRTALLQVVPPRGSSARQAPHLREAVHDLIEKYHVLQGFDADTIARALHVSRRKLYRDLADEEEGIAGLIAASRVRTAAAMLVAQPLASLGEVAAAAGFGDATTMRRHFLTRMGSTPADYRRTHV